uniref:Uncharacterized protein n=1 Tax=uncultured prokaryote TaxID=198431 RepID=A0A0H5Q5T7_9ZZZZ|nr:hypothetical protein [uncultured prokaryote]
MPLPGLSSRFSFVGTLPGGEVFDTSFWLQAYAPESQAEAQATTEDIAASFVSNALASCKPLMSTFTVIESLKGYFYPEGGTAATYVTNAPIASGTGSGGALHPNQVGLVLTLRSVSPTRSGRGRMYWPMQGCLLTAGGLNNTSYVNTWVDSMADFFSDIHDVVTGADVAVVSVTQGVSRVVTSVSADPRPDIQRRRANKQTTGTVHTAVITGL